ncbi:hypothetical protein JW921_01305 [Candidatus Fermentibacterales bacterium]|nr:hypothetical protein [Candidatus Fermentibacterales bacterium]
MITVGRRCLLVGVSMLAAILTAAVGCKVTTKPSTHEGMAGVEFGFEEDDEEQTGTVAGSGGGVTVFGPGTPGSMPGVIRRTPAMECWQDMMWIEETVVAYRDSLGCFPPSLGEAWDWYQGLGFISLGSTSIWGTMQRPERLPRCPEGKAGGYLYEHTDNSYTITCPSGHGSIVDGVRSWE